VYLYLTSLWRIAFVLHPFLSSGSSEQELKNGKMAMATVAVLENEDSAKRIETRL
jgi:uncharacterized protein YjaG (DUF416 family)